MEPGFKAALSELRRQAVRPKDKDELDETVEQLGDALGLDEVAEARGLRKESVIKILSLQKEKQRIMEWLKA